MAAAKLNRRLALNGKVVDWMERVTGEDYEAYERLLKSDAKYRFSIDMASLKSE
jgi:hypothetical protein